MQDANASDGSISLGAGATVSATQNSGSLGNVYIVVGDIPNNPTAGATPANVAVNSANGGVVYFGNGLTTSTPTNTVNANGTQVVFSAPNSSAISMGGNVTINNSIALEITLNSLDFTDPAVTSAVLQDITGGYIIGTLTVNANGVATGGNVTITPSVLASSTLLGDYINTSNLTVDLQGFTSVLNVNLVTGTTHTTQVVINGTEAFIVGSSPSNSGLNITTDNHTGPALVIGSSGVLSSDSVLTVTANGDIAMNGTVSSDTITLQTTANNGNILLGGNVTGNTSVTLNAFGSGNITRTAGTVTANLINLFSATGDAGSNGARLVLASAGGGNQLFVQTGGNAYLTYRGAVTLEQSYVGTSQTLDLLTTCRGDILIDGDSVTGGTINLTADTTGNIYQSLNNSVLSATTLNLTSGSGNIGGPASPAAANLTFSANTVTANTGGSGNAYLTDTISGSSASIGSSSVGMILCITAPNTGVVIAREQPFKLPVKQEVLQL